MDRSKVRVKATITPALSGVTVYFSAIDVDDPSDDQAPIDDESNEFDNRGGTIFMGSATTTSGVATTEYSVPLQPGDNVVVVADCSSSYIDRLRNVDANGDGWEVYEYDGDTLVAAVPTGKKTQPLTTRRTLYVEVDSMGSEPQGTQFNADDLLRGDVPDPDYNAFADAFKTAYIDKIVKVTNQSNGNTPWVYNFVGDTQGFIDYFVGTNGQRGTRNQEKQTYWVVYVCGIYELGHLADPNVGDLADNDPNTEFANLGTTYNVEPEFSVIPEEVLRDVAAQWGWTDAQKTHVHKGVTLHEIGHQFGLSHHNNFDAGGKPADVMWGPASDTQEDKAKDLPLTFSKGDIAKIRGVTFP